MNFIDVISYVAGRPENLFDGLPIQQGVHLYWSWHRRLPYPLGGFTVTKGENPPELVARLPVPANPETALRRLNTHPDYTILRDRFSDTASDVHALLAELTRPPDPYARQQRLLPDMGDRSTIRMTLQNALLMGCLDPYIARMAGVSFLDPTAPGGHLGSYRVIGHWGGEYWPIFREDFARLPVLNRIHAPLRLGDLQIYALNRDVSVNDPAAIDIYDKHLIVSGNGSPAVRFELDYPVEGFVLEFYDGWSAPGATWQIAVDGEVVSGAVTTSAIGMIRPGRPFRILDIVSGPDGPWRFAGALFQERNGAIGDQASDSIVPRLLPAEETMVPTPELHRLIRQPAPAILDENGYIRDHHSDIKQFVHTQAPEDFVHQAVRMHFSKLSGTAAGANSGLFLPRGDRGLVDPLPVQSGGEELILTGLQAYFSFNQVVKNLKNGEPARVFGRSRYLKDHPEDEQKYVLQLDGNGFISLAATPGVKNLGRTFSFHCWLRVDADNPEPYPTIVGNRWEVSCWWGLARTETGNYRMRFWMSENESGADRQFQSNTEIRPGEWTSVGVSYNGQYVQFYAHGVPDARHEAALGDLLWNPGPMNLGAESGSTGSAFYYPLKGAIADLAIWERRIGPEEGMSRIRSQGVYLAQQQPYANLIYRHYQRITFGPVSEPFRLPADAQLQALGNSFTIQLWVNPRGVRQDYPTLIGNNWMQSFWLGLMPSGDQFIPRLWLNKAPDNFDNLFHADRGLPEDRWSLLTFSYDGEVIRFYIDGRPAGVYPAALGPLRTNDQAITLGADATSIPSRRDYPFQGSLSDIQIWREALTPAQINAKLSVHQWTDRGVPDHTYHYYARGVDIFGRTSNWSGRKRIVAASAPEHSPPVNVHAQFLKIRGRVTGVRERANGFTLVTDLALSSDILGALTGYDVKLTRQLSLQDPPFDQPPRRQPVLQAFSIESAELEEDRVLLQVTVPPYAFFFPDDRKRDWLEIEFDRHFAVRWAWSGLQQLYNASVDEFQIFLKTGSMNVLRGQVTSVEELAGRQFRVSTNIRANLVINELVDTACSIGPNKFFIRQHGRGNNLRFDLEYLGEPLVRPEAGQLFIYNVTPDHSVFVNYNNTGNWDHSYDKIPLGEPQVFASNRRSRAEVVLMNSVTPEQLNAGDSPAAVERRNLFERGVDWLPNGPFYKISFTRFSLPAALRRPETAHYVPGALVGYVQQGVEQHWRDFYVFWHAWADNQLIVYALPHEKGEVTPSFIFSDATPSRFYIGKHFSVELPLPANPVFPALDPNLNYHLALNASDADGHNSGLSPIIRMVAVNRRRPPRPEPPRIVSISKLDYYQLSKVSIEWDALPEPGIAFHLFRATDAAIYEQDLLQRRTRQGIYRGLSASRIFEDDPDMGVWIRTKDLRVTNSLFPAPNTPEWREMTPIWRAWAERFYPSRTPAELGRLANAPGNEKAFTLLNPKPTTDLEFQDQVNGRINNRYYYRLRSQSVSLQQSTQWSSVSDPVVPPLYHPPAKPVITKIEAGDRRISLAWSMNREPTFQEVILYRGRDARAIEDIRWWSVEPDPRIVARVGDPRIKTENRSIRLPGSLPLNRIQDIRGVFRLDAFDFAADDPRNQPRAMNYWVTRSAYPSGPSLFTPAPDETGRHELSNLRPVADGVAMVLVYRDPVDRQFKLFAQYHTPGFGDADLLGLTDYYYRLLAVDHDRNVSEPSEIRRARTLEIEPPAAPAVLLDRQVIDPDRQRIQLEYVNPHPAYQLLIQRRNDGDLVWTNVVPWQIPDGSPYIEEVDTGQIVEYKVWCKTPSNMTCHTPPTVLSLPVM